MQNMAESVEIKEMVNQTAIQLATAVMMALRDTYARPLPTTTASHREPQRQWHSGTIFEKLLFNWDA